MKGKNIATCSLIKISSPNTEGLSTVTIESQESKVVTETNFDKALLMLFKLKLKIIWYYSTDKLLEYSKADKIMEEKNVPIYFDNKLRLPYSHGAWLI